MARRQLPQLDDSSLVEVCERFLKGERAAAIAGWLNRQHHSTGGQDRISREQVYELLRVARQRKLFSIHPPPDDVLRQRLVDYFRLRDKTALQVVGAIGESALEYVANETAVLTLRLIKEIGSQKRDVHLGLGAGSTTRQVVQRLVVLLRTEPVLPNLVLHALTPGYQGDQPSAAPVAFFGLFDTLPTKMKYYGLFAPSLVEVKDYNNTIQQPGIKEAYDQKDNIDIVITSLASETDAHGALHRIFSGHQNELSDLRRAGWVGDVQCRPYSSKSTLEKPSTLRPLTLLEIRDFVKMASTPQKYVVVACGPCGTCGKSRADALRPLLTVPPLKLWTNVIMDIATARALLSHP